MEDRKVVARVSGVAFDSHRSAPSSDGTGENVNVSVWFCGPGYSAASVGPGNGWNCCTTSLLSWWITNSLQWKSCSLRRCFPCGQPAPSRRDVPKISPVVARRVHVEPLSGLVFTSESVPTICQGHIKIWVRPGHSSDVVANAVDPKDRLVATSFKVSGFFSGGFITSDVHLLVN